MFQHGSTCFNPISLFEKLEYLEIFGNIWKCCFSLGWKSTAFPFAAPGVAQVPWHGSAAVPSQVERRGVAAAAPGKEKQSETKNAINIYKSI